MIVHLMLAIAVLAFIVYTFIYSPWAIRIGNELFYDPLEDSLRRYGGNEE